MTVLASWFLLGILALFRECHVDYKLKWITRVITVPLKIEICSFATQQQQQKQQHSSFKGLSAGDKVQFSIKWGFAFWIDA